MPNIGRYLAGISLGSMTSRVELCSQYVSMSILVLLLTQNITNRNRFHLLFFFESWESQNTKMPSVL